MRVTEVRGLIISQVVDDELPNRVTIVGSRNSVHGAGITLAGALLVAFNVSGMFPDQKFTRGTELDLAQFIGYRFPKLTDNMKRAISVLTTASDDAAGEGSG